jgi:hypothetical protein
MPRVWTEEIKPTSFVVTTALAQLREFPRALPAGLGRDSLPPCARSFRPFKFICSCSAARRRASAGPPADELKNRRIIELIDMLRIRLLKRAVLVGMSAGDRD